VKRRRVASFEEPVRKLGDRRGFIDLFWKGVVLVEQKSAGRSLVDAYQQALDYFPGIRDDELPRYVLLCDFQSWELHDLEDDSVVSFALGDLPDHVEAFGFVLGIEKRIFRDQDPVNIRASELMGRLHDALAASGYSGHDLERLLVRLLFCLFADDTGIFEPRDLFHSLIKDRTREDGSDLGLWLTQLFEVLNEPEVQRQSMLDEDLAAFPYVNGDLFTERLRVPAFNAEMRTRLIEACEFDWGAISPAIFGALFQSVMNPQRRRAQGAHYTTEQNILKVIRPLFLDDLWAELRRLAARRDTGRRAALEAFHQRLAALRLLDPACGCGNFLIIAYRELRELELELLRAMGRGAQQELDVAALIRLDVGQFFGIELDEFASRIAEVAMWMTDHIANVRASLQFGQVFTRIPLRASPHIDNADALEIDWATVLPPTECSYVFGNPPFVGAKYQSEAQRAQVRRIAALGGSGGTLDYVTAWFLKAGEYVQVGGGRARIGFVATNSVTNGEQVPQLWPLLFDRYRLEIAFAHRTFAWGSDARGMAHVHVVILGLTHRTGEVATKRLFSYADPNGDPMESPHSKLSPYLIDASRLGDPHLVVREAARPINGAPPIAIGSKPIDGGHLILDAQEAADLLTAEPAVRPYLRPYVGARELINGGDRWIMALRDASPTELRAMPRVLERLDRVREFRLRSTSSGTRVLADTPTLFHVTVLPDRPFLAIPEVSSERREYVPLAYLEPPTVPSNLVRVVPDADLWRFAVLTSGMNMAWLRNIGGRLESRYRYSIGIVYNTFPWPVTDDTAKSRLRALGQAVLDARAAYPASSLADLYDPRTMSPALRRAHRTLDEAVDRLYRARPFADDRERVEHLLGLYEAAAAPLLVSTPRAGRRRRGENSTRPLA
jgi:hypothetical protein